MCVTFLTRKIANNIKVQGTGNHFRIAEDGVPLKGSSNISGYEEWPQWNTCGDQKEMEDEDSRLMFWWEMAGKFELKHDCLKLHSQELMHA